jgi:hypothetical protein
LFGVSFLVEPAKKMAGLRHRKKGDGYDRKMPVPFRPNLANGVKLSSSPKCESRRFLAWDFIDNPE